MMLMRESNRSKLAGLGQLANYQVNAAVKLQGSDPCKASKQYQRTSHVLPVQTYFFVIVNSIECGCLGTAVLVCI